MLHKTKLKNGIVVASDYIKYIESVSISITFKTGSRNENANNNGISHFIEHMLFKGTKTRTAVQIANECEAIGASFNAYTSKESTCFYGKVLREYAEKFFEILSDLVQNSIFLEEELEKERNVILQEIAMTNDAPDDIIDEYFLETAFPNQAFGRCILGSENNVKKFQKQDFINYMDEHYITDNLYITCTGNLEQSKAVELTNKYITTIPMKKKSKIEKAVYSGGYFTKNKDLEQVQCILGFKGLSYHTEDYYKFHIMNNIFGGGMSSRLFQNIRENQGLCYTIYSSNSSTIETGTFEIYTATDSENVNKSIDSIINEMHKFINDGVTDTELERSKIKIKSNLLMQLENSNYRSSFLSNSVIFKNKLPSKDEIIEQLESTTKQNVVDFLASFIKSKPTIALYGDLQNVYDYGTIENKLK